MSNVKYIYHPVMFGGKVLKVVRSAENDYMWVCRDNTGYPIFFKYMDGNWFSYVKPTSTLDIGRTEEIAAFEATDENRDALSTLYPALEFERFESKAKKLLSFFSKNEGKYVVCGITGLGLVLVYKVDYINDRLELDVSTDLITRRTVVVDAANAEKEVCFLGDECVVSVV